MPERQGQSPIVVARGVDLNAVADTLVTIPVNGAEKYIVRKMILTNVSATMAGSLATIGAYSAAAAGGTAIVTPATATGLTSAAKFDDRTIAATVTLTGSTIYIRVGVVHGSAMTCDVYFYLDILD
jgi:hypothetical protein